MKTRHPHPYLGKLHPRLWIAFVAVWVALCSCEFWLRSRYEQRYNDWVEHREMLRHAEQEVMKPINDSSPYWTPSPPYTISLGGPSFRIVILTLPSSLSGPPQPPKLTKAKIEELLGTRLVTTSVEQVTDVQTGREVVCEDAMFRDPDRYPDLTLSLHFQEDNLIGEECITSRPAPTRPVLYKIGSQVHRFMLPYWVYIWLCSTVPVFLLQRHSVVFAEFTVMLAIAATLMHLPSLSSYPGIEDFLDVAYLPWGLAMIAGSIALLSWAYFTEKSRLRVRCPNCEYNLRGNQSGRCPECGASIPEDLRQRLTFDQAA